MTEMLSWVETFLCGCFGGAIAFTVIMLLPELRATWRSKNFAAWPQEGVAIAIALGVVQILLGGAVAVWFGDAATAKQAISYGIAAETLVGGVARAVTEDPTSGQR